METYPYAAPNATIESDAAAVPGVAARVGFWPRLGAVLLDGLIAGIIAAVIARPVASLFPRYLAYLIEQAQARVGDHAGRFTSSGFSSSWAIALALVSAVYHLTEMLFAASPGKMLLGLRIAGADARRASIGRLAARMVLKNASTPLKLFIMFTGLFVLEKIDMALGFALLVSYLPILAKSRRALHDFVAGTAVYRASDVAER
jgi:uncharacterized RDD family membrane protein YckC